MRGTLKTSTLESKFPLLAVEGNCILSKFADVTAAFRVTLPELFTLTAEEYEALHATLVKALKVLPDHTVVHKQDLFIEERYETSDPEAERTFLSRAYERHFNERPFLRHTCHLFITKSTPERLRQTSAASVLCRGFIIPQESRDGEAVTRFLESVAQMERILNDSGLLRVERLTEAEIVGTDSDAGLLARYFALSDERQPTVNEDIRLDPGMMRIGDKLLSMHTLSDLDLLPQSVATDFRYERLSTDRSECRLSFAAPAGLLLGCSHIYNQYLFLDNHDETLKRLEARARNMNSLANYSRGNALNKEWIDLFPLLRPMAIGICIMFFPTLVLGSLNGILSPLVQATHSLMVGQTFDMQEWRQECARLEQESRERLPAESYYTEDEEKERELQALGINEQSQQALDRMQSERKSWSIKGMILKALTAIMELFFAAAGVILDVLRTFYLIVLSLLGPIAFAISIFDGFQNTLVQWFSKYISIYLWLPISDLFSAIIARLQTLSLQHDAEMMAQDYNWYFDMSNSINLIFILVAICGYLCIPSIASWVVQANGFSSYNRTISRATSLVSGGAGWITGKVWAGTKSTAGGVGKGLASAARLILKK